MSVTERCWHYAAHPLRCCSQTSRASSSRLASRVRKTRAALAFSPGVAAGPSLLSNHYITQRSTRKQYQWLTEQVKPKVWSGVGDTASASAVGDADRTRSTTHMVLEMRAAYWRWLSKVPCSRAGGRCSHDCQRNEAEGA